MSSTSLDFTALLAPIPGDNLCGADLRWESVYQEIKDARKQGDRDMLGADEPVVADWPTVLAVATGVLERQSKDLMIACWLTEALVHRHGFAGLRDGLKLIAELLQQYWDGLYPAIDDGDLEPRVAPLVWLTEPDRGARLPNSLRAVPLTPDKEEAFSWNYWKARYPQNKGENEEEETYNRRKAEADEKARRFEEAVTATSREFVAALYQDVHDSTAELARLEKVLDEKLGKQAPGTTALRQALSECEVLVRRILREKGGAVEEEPTSGGEVTAGRNGQATSSKGPISSREDAFRRLSEVAAFLRQTEPQSPVSYLIERAVVWGRMPFEQLLTEMIRDATVRGQVGELLGIKPPEQS